MKFYLIIERNQISECLKRIINKETISFNTNNLIKGKPALQNALFSFKDEIIIEKAVVELTMPELNFETINKITVFDFVEESKASYLKPRTFWKK